MKRRSRIASAVIFLCIQVCSGQTWVNEILEKGLSNPNGIVDALLSEMKNTLGSSAPGLRFEKITEGQADSLSGYRGVVTLVALWKTNCSGCRMQLPQISNLQTRYTAKGLQVVWHPLEGIKSTVNIRTLARPYQLLATPSAYVVDTNGIIREVWIVPEKYDSLEKRVLPYLE